MFLVALSSNALLAVRTYALWLRSRKTAVSLSFVALILLIPTSIVVGFEYADKSFIQYPITSFVKPASNPTCRWRRSSKISGGSHIADMLWADGLLYAFSVVAFTILQLVFESKIPPLLRPVTIQIQSNLHSLLSTRIGELKFILPALKESQNAKIS
ncbi:hypothetical protein CCMSSC00406_0002250 [Pleurotus cornucopiae]|uniref:Uncharacterized protein n=1 Tax=Pleurotus cornucopiae TaxID=5321 RepID=A0ACB7J3J3_PLECO|nr:hypothetical protein CCMSSC00406_0002250 [Pleurotus cornucopiae]